MGLASDMGSGAWNFEYTASPTCRKFHRCNARARCIVGPVGCLPCDTEVMTPVGWVRIDEWDGQEILQWNSESGVAEFLPPKRRIVGACPEGMLRFDCGRHMQMTVTAGHTVPVTDWRGRFVAKKAFELAERPSRNTLVTTWRGGGDGCGITEDMLRVWTMIVSDGTYPKANNQCYVTVRKARKVERAKQVLDAAGIRYLVRSFDRHGSVETRISFIRPDLPKHFDWRLSRCTASEARAVVDEMRNWDGLCAADYDRFDTSVRQDADIFQFLCHVCGRNATMSEFVDRRNEAWSKMYCVHPARYGSAKNKVMIRCDSCKVENVNAPDGRQYCFETVTGFFVVRQNGHVFVTGNSGKSSAIIAGEVMKRAMEQQADPEGRRRTRVVMIRNTYNELTTTTLKTFREWWGFTICTYRSDKPLSAFIRFPMQDGTIVECEVIFLAMDKPEDVGKLRSLEVTWGYINEGSEIVDYEIFDALLERIGRFPKKWKNERGEKVGGPTWYGACIDTNAPDDEHWIYQKFEVEKPDGFEIFHQPPAVLLKEGSTPENPVWEANKGQREGVPAAENIENIPVGWAYYVNQLAGKSYEKIRVMLCGEYGTVAYGRPVFPEYNDRIHYLPNRIDPRTERPMEVEVMRGLPVLLGIDFGIQYAACIFAQLSTQRQLRAIEELVVKDVGTRDFADLIHGVLAKRYMGMVVKAFGDPCARSRDRQTGITDIDLLNECGIPTVAAPTNDPRQRREAVVYFMQRLVGDGQPALVLGSKCPMLRKGFAGRYYYKKISTSGREEIFRPDPVKNEYSHPNDGLQYIATSLLYDHNAAEAAMMAVGGQGAFGFGTRQQERPIPFGIDSGAMY